MRFPILIFNSVPILISEDFNKWPKLSPILMSNMQKRGLAPKEFEASLTKKVNRLLESTGVGRREPFIKEAITKVTTQVTRRKTNARRRRGQSGTKMYHNKQKELFTGPLQPKCQLFRDRGVPIRYKQDGYLYRGDYMLTAPKFCNVVDQFSSDFLKDISRMRGDNQWRPTVDFRKVSKLCKEILISRLDVAYWSVENDLLDDSHNWGAHVMVIISFAALMVVAEMTLKELEKLPRHQSSSNNSSDGESAIFVYFFVLVVLIVVSICLLIFSGSIPT